MISRTNTDALHPLNSSAKYFVWRVFGSQDDLRRISEKPRINENPEAAHHKAFIPYTIIILCHTYAKLKVARLPGQYDTLRLPPGILRITL